MRLCPKKLVALLCCLSLADSFCVLDKKKGWWLDCGLRDSYLFRLKDFGGFQANFNLGFGLGDEKGFPNSITQTDGKGKAQYFPSHPKYHIGQPAPSQYGPLKPPQYGHRRSDQPRNTFKRDNYQSSTAKPSSFSSWFSKPREFFKSLVKPSQKRQNVESYNPQPQIRRQSFKTQPTPRNNNGGRIYRPRPNQSQERNWIQTNRQSKPNAASEVSSSEWEPVDRTSSPQYQLSSSQPQRHRFGTKPARTQFPSNQWQQSHNSQVPLQQNRFSPQPFRSTQQPNYQKNPSVSHYKPNAYQEPTGQEVPKSYENRPEQTRRWSGPTHRSSDHHWRSDNQNFNRIETSNPSFNLVPPPRRQFVSPQSRFEQQPVVFHQTTTTTERPTVGPDMGSLLKVPSDMFASSDNVPSFAAKMFVIREAPVEFYPPNYDGYVDPNRPKLTVNIPRTQFYCEEQKYLPGIYADAKLGCKMFHLCVPYSVGSTLTSYLCPNGTLFDQSILQCNHWYNVDCESSISDYDANMALALSYRRINAAHLPLQGATDVNTLSLLSQNVVGQQKPKPTATNRMGKLLKFSKNSDSKNEDFELKSDVSESKSKNYTVEKNNKDSSKGEEVGSSLRSYTKDKSLNLLENDVEPPIDELKYEELMKLIVQTQKRFRNLKFSSVSEPLQKSGHNFM